MLERFCGPDGRILLVEALKIHPVVGGDMALAESTAEESEVVPFEPDSNIIEKSTSDNDLYFILSGVPSDGA